MPPNSLQHYRILVHGRNVLYELNRVRILGGFYVNCSVFAPSSEAAAEAAIEMVRKDPRFAESVLNARGDPQPTLLAEEVEVIPASDKNPLGISTGYVWYGRDEDQPPLS